MASEKCKVTCEERIMNYLCKSETEESDISKSHKSSDDVILTEVMAVKAL
jgi:hypothetical protein